jgi:hypothetical protein
MDLTVILRCCGKTGVAPNSTPRISGTDRLELVLKSIASLVEAINSSKYRIKFLTLDDHSDQDSKDKIKKIVEGAQCEKEFVELADKPDVFIHGFNWSAYEQFRHGRESNGLVYFVEDDYLHSKNAIDELLDAFYFFRQLSDLNNIAIYPYDSTHNYNGYSMPTRLFYLQDRLWRTTGKTANTMLIHSDDVRKYWELFERLAVMYSVDHTNEDTTINRLWNNGVIQGGPITLFSPIPSIAVHVSFDEPIVLTNEMNNWRERYNQVEI